MKTFLFYDIETTGLNKSFDQVLQFAAIRTDLELHELERHEIFVKLRPDVIPSPYALITHRIGLQKLHAGITEYEAIKKIHFLMNTPGTISLGYNTLGFDDEFLRFAFYRNLLSPYTHQYANSCSRMDLFPLVIMYWLFKPEVLKWPMVDNKISLRLENLNALNHLSDGLAHNAIVDVEATVALGKYLMKSKDMWEYVADYYEKNIDVKRMQQLPEVFGRYQQGIIVQGRLGAAQNFVAPVLFLGEHGHYKNQTLWLRLDDEKLQQTNKDNIEKTTWVFRKKPAEPGFLLPPLPRYLKLVDENRQKITVDNILWLRENTTILQAIEKFHKEYTYPEIPDLDIDAALYQNGFFSDFEQKLCQKFHEQDWAEKISMLENLTPNIRILASRLILRNSTENFQQGVPKQDIHNYQEYLQKMFTINNSKLMLDYKGEPKLTKQQALVDIEQIFSEKSLDEEQQNLLGELKAYLQGYMEETV